MILQVTTDFLNALYKKLTIYSFGSLAGERLFWLVSPRGHGALLASRRAEMIRSRALLVAVAFAVLTPLWTIVEYLSFDHELWLALMWARLAATLGFVGIVLGCYRSGQSCRAEHVLMTLFAIPVLFFLYTTFVLQGHALSGFARAVVDTHVFLPFLLLAGMAIFPLTVLECAVLTLFVLLAKAVSTLPHNLTLAWPSMMGIYWLLCLTSAVSTLASISQLGFAIVLVRQAVRDPLTGCFSRQSGEELMGLQFKFALRNKTPLSVAFLDIDFFKRVNDQYGHQAGDEVLTHVAKKVLDQLRTVDILIRWGGEEFILLMPNIDMAGAVVALERLRETGFGTRPEATPLTMSIGVAERMVDGIQNWKALVDLADERMYQAKQAGRNRVIAR